MSSLFEKNISSLAQVSPQLASKIFAINENSKYEVFFDENDSANINIIDRANFSPLYKGQPVSETLEAVKNFEMKALFPYLYFFGIGNGILFKLLLKNNNLKRIVIVEPSLELIYISLHFSDFSEEILNERVVILLSEDINFSFIAALFTRKDVKIYSKLYDLEVLLPYYEEHYSNEIMRVNQVFLKAIKYTVIGLGNDSIDSLIGLEHHLMNVDRMVETPTLEDFVKKASNTKVAVIVSTGPSLTKQLDLLEKYKNYITIFCIDASFPILSKKGIKPDVVVSMERVPLTGEFFKQTPESSHEGVVFVLSSIQHPNVIDNIKAGTKVISMRPFGYTKIMKLDKWGYAGIGMSSANLAFELVYHSGFEACILIGQDLAYAEDGKSHASAHILGEDEVKYKHSDMFVTSYGGQAEVRTSYIWNMFKNQFEIDIMYAKEKMRVINATEGGARIDGSEELCFKEALNILVNTKALKKPIRLKPLNKKKVGEYKKIAQDTTEDLYKYVCKISHEVETLFVRVADVCKKIEKEGKLEQLNDNDYETIQVLLLELDNIKAYFEEEKFAKLFMDSVQAFIIHQEMEIAKIVTVKINNEEEKKAKVLKWLFAHRYWLFSLAACIHAVKIAFERKGSHYKDNSIKAYNSARIKLQDNLEKSIVKESN